MVPCLYSIEDLYLWRFHNFFSPSLSMPHFLLLSYRLFVFLPNPNLLFYPLNAIYHKLRKQIILIFDIFWDCVIILSLLLSFQCKLLNVLILSSKELFLDSWWFLWFFSFCLVHTFLQVQWNYLRFTSMVHIIFCSRMMLLTHAECVTLSQGPRTYFLIYFKHRWTTNKQNAYMDT